MKNATGMNQMQYAAHAGISRGAVQKAIKTNRIVLHQDGSINAAASDKRRAEQTDPAQQRGRQSPENKIAPVPADAIDAVNEALGGAGLQPASDPGLTTFVQARTANEILKAKERKVRLAKLSGSLVDAHRASALVFALGRQERDSWLNWPARVAAQMAAELGVDGREMMLLLDTYVRRHLDELSEIKLPLDQLIGPER